MFCGGRDVTRVVSTRGTVLSLVTVLLALARTSTGGGEGGIEAAVFLETPQSVLARPGEDVVLRCRVADPLSSVQWTRDRIALGFERTVPGYPRYQYEGELSLGEHHLVIKRVTLEDEGHYQCQVTPAVSTAPPVTSPANLTVMVAPSSISVSGGVGAGRGQGEGVVEVRAGRQVGLECLVTNSRPPATVVWYRNGLKIGKDVHREEVWVSSGGERVVRWDVRSRLVVVVTPEDHTQQYSCRALHPALHHSPTTLVASLTLNVLHAPGPPLITGYRTGEALTEGEQRILTCQVVGGNPRPWVTWYRHGRPFNPSSMLQPTVLNPQQLVLQSRSALNPQMLQALPVLNSEMLQQSPPTFNSQMLKSLQALNSEMIQSPLALNSEMLQALPSFENPVLRGQSSLINSRTLRSPQTLSQSLRSGRPQVLQVPAETPTGENEEEGNDDELGGEEMREGVVRVEVEQAVRAAREEDGAVYECRVTSPLLTTPLTTNVTLTVHYAPAGVRVSGARVVVAGDPLDLTCTASPANPPPTLTWTLQGVNVGEGVREVRQDEGGGWVTTSRLAHLLAGSLPAQEEARAQCSATHVTSPTAPITATWSFNIVRRPGIPVLVVEEAGGGEMEGEVEIDEELEVEEEEEVVAGTTLRIVCSCDGGHPPPVVTLDKDGEALEVVVQQGVGGATRVWTEVDVGAADNGAVVRCSVTSPATPTPLTATTTLHLKFPAEEVRAWVVPETVEEGQSATLTCQTSSSRPPSLLTWHSSGAVLQADNITHSPALYSGTSTRSQVQVRATRGDSGRVFSCDAHNGLGITLNANVTLDVVYGPLWVEEPGEEVEVEEGEDLVIVVAAEANPTPIRYSWWRGPQRVEGVDGVGSRTGRLHLQALHRQDAGGYSVTASNSYTALNASFSINVLYPPEGVAVAERVTVDENGTASVKCTAVGNPTPTLTWTRHPHLNSTLVMGPWAGEGEAWLVLERAEREDTGFYHCHASNKVGTAPPVTTALVVAQEPMLPETTRGVGGVVGGAGAKWWARTGGKARLKCRVVAAPAPSFRWTVNTTRVILNSAKYFVRSPQLLDGLVEWESVLELRSVVEEDYTEYSCTATNTKGSLTTNHTLTPPHPPPTPTHLQVSAVRGDSVTLTWALPRHHHHNTTTTTTTRASAATLISDLLGFTLRYRTAGHPEYKEVEVVGGNTSSVIVGQLRAGLEYYFTLQAHSLQGRSPFTSPPVVVTIPEAEGLASSSQEGGGHPRLPLLLVLLLSLTAAAFLVLNVAIVVFFVRRYASRRRRRAHGSPEKGLPERKQQQEKQQKGEHQKGSVVGSDTSSLHHQHHHHHHHPSSLTCTGEDTTLITPADIQVPCRKGKEGPEMIEVSEKPFVHFKGGTLATHKRSFSQQSIDNISVRSAMPHVTTHYSSLPRPSPERYYHHTSLSDLKEQLPQSQTFPSPSIPRYQRIKDITLSRPASPASDSEIKSRAKILSSPYPGRTKEERYKQGTPPLASSSPRGTRDRRHQLEGHRGHEMEGHREQEVLMGSGMDEAASDDNTSDSSTETRSHGGIQDSGRKGDPDSGYTTSTNIPDVCLKGPRNCESILHHHHHHHHRQPDKVTDSADEDRLSVSSQPTNESYVNLKGHTVLPGSPEPPPPHHYHSHTGQRLQHRPASPQFLSVSDPLTQPSLGHGLPTKPTSQVIYHGQPHLQQQLEKEQQQQQQQQQLQQSEDQLHCNAQQQLQDYRQDSLNPLRVQQYPVHPLRQQEEDPTLLQTEQHYLAHQDLPHLSYKHNLTSIHEEPGEQPPQHQQQQQQQQHWQNSLHRQQYKHHSHQQHPSSSSSSSSPSLYSHQYPTSRPHHVLTTPHHDQYYLPEAHHHHHQRDSHGHLPESHHHLPESHHHMPETHHRLTESHPHGPETHQHQLPPESHHHLPQSKETHSGHLPASSYPPPYPQDMPCCQPGGPCTYPQSAPLYPDDRGYCQYCVASAPCCDDRCRTPVVDNLE